jgi:sugar lactone lactonase YvrE
VDSCGKNGAACKSCKDTSVCTTDACLPDGTCENAPVKDGTPCDDGQICSHSDQCTGGACKGTTYSCPSASCGTATCTGDPPPDECSATVDPGKCLIDGACYNEGDFKVGSSQCERCVTAQSASSWTPVPNSGCVITLAGTGTAGFKDGSADTAQFSNPVGVAVSGSTVYVADMLNHRIRRISGGIVSTLAGSGAAGFADGQAVSAKFNQPSGVTVTSSGSVFVADSGNHRLRRISGGNVSTYAGSGTPGFADGPAGSAQLDTPTDVTWNLLGIFVAEAGNHAVRVISGGNVATYAGTGTYGNKNGPALSAQFNNPNGLTVGTYGSIYVGDTNNHMIRSIYESSGTTTVTTYAGTGTAGYQDGSKAQSQFNKPGGLANGGTLLTAILAADSGNHRIRRISYLGGTSTIAGSGTPGYKDGEASMAQFNQPTDVAVGSGKIYVADSKNHCIRVIIP